MAGAAGGGDAQERRRPVEQVTELSIETFVAGSDTYPKANQRVRIHYTAYRADGEFFDSSRARKRPFTFVTGQEQVIPGLEQAVLSISVGERAKVSMPAKLAYGERGFPGRVPKNMSLFWDVELLSVEDA